ncbi:MAG: flagellar hook capping FlgD N-terminal domain-containing protein [Balneolaceae bacterium]
MNVNGITGTEVASQPVLPNKSGELGKNEFLQLLITQMRHQDPLNPMEGTEFASQLAQFNSVEQLINLNDGVENLAIAQDLMSSGLNNSLAASLAGKKVRVMSSEIAFNGSDDSGVHFRLQNPASSVEINIMDQNGTIIRSEKMENLGAGDHTWAWDGKTGNGLTAPQGTYSIDIKSMNGDDEINTLTFMEGEVEKVRFSDRGVELLVDGILLPLGDVEEIGN